MSSLPGNSESFRDGLNYAPIRRIPYTVRRGWSEEKRAPLAIGGGGGGILYSRGPQAEQRSLVVRRHYGFRIGPVLSNATILPPGNAAELKFLGSTEGLRDQKHIPPAPSRFLLYGFDTTFMSENPNLADQAWRLNQR
ncbi:hypothetical protein B0H19DRAFT_1062835 [Mycena capillaripes]|nr:hypothetical protein B0H19DRAFT_1062835 [Mycena capillaripes]